MDSLCVSCGPGQPLGLLQDEDRSSCVVRRALDLVRGESQELGSAVGEPERQVRASLVVSSVRAPGHHASHEAGHRGLHPSKHDGPPAPVAAAPAAAAAWVPEKTLRLLPRLIQLGSTRLGSVHFGSSRLGSSRALPPR